MTSEAKKAQSMRWKKANPHIVKATKARWHANNPGRAAELGHEWKKNKPAKYLYGTTKQKVKLSGAPFDLTVEWLEKRLKPMRCEVTGLPLSFNWDMKNKSLRHPWTPSIDQKKPSEGYTKKNCQVVCWAYNVAKHTWDKKTVMKLAKALLKGEG